MSLVHPSCEVNTFSAAGPPAALAGSPKNRDDWTATLRDYHASGLALLVLHGLEWLPTADGEAHLCACPRRHLCGCPGKHPLRFGWQKLDGPPPIEKTLAEAKQYEGDLVWRHGPAYYLDPNIGIHLGASRLICLDCDPRNGGDASLAELVARCGELPVTVQDRSGNRRGGGHWFFRAPGPGVLPTGKKLQLLPGLDLLQGENQVVIPPSMHAHGRRYEWIHDPRAVGFAPLPQSIIDLLWERQRKQERQERERQEEVDRPRDAHRKAVAAHAVAAPSAGGGAVHSRVVERARKYIDRIGPAISGQSGSKVTCSAACALVLGFELSVADALPLLEEWNRGHASPPWPTEELFRRLEWAAGQGGTRGYLLHQRPARCGRGGEELAALDGVELREVMPKARGGDGASAMPRFDLTAWQPSPEAIAAMREVTRRYREARDAEARARPVAVPPRLPPRPECRKARIRMEHVEDCREQRTVGCPCGSWSCDICLPWKRDATMARLRYHLERDSWDGLAFVAEVPVEDCDRIQRQVNAAGGRWAWVRGPRHERCGTRLLLATRLFRVGDRWAEDMPVAEALGRFGEVADSIQLRDGDRRDHPTRFCRAWHDLEEARERTGDWKVLGKMELTLSEHERLLTLCDIPYRPQRRQCGDRGPGEPQRQGWEDIAYRLPDHWDESDVETWHSWHATGCVPWAEIEAETAGWRAEPFRPSQRAPFFDPVGASP